MPSERERLVVRLTPAQMAAVEIARERRARVVSMAMRAPAEVTTQQVGLSLLLAGLEAEGIKVGVDD